MASGRIGSLGSFRAGHTPGEWPSPKSRRSPHLEKPASGGCHDPRTGRGQGMSPDRSGLVTKPPEVRRRLWLQTKVGFYLATTDSRKILPGYMGQEAGPTPASARGTRDLARGAGSDPRGPLVPGAGGGLAVPYVRRSEELQRLQGAVRGGVARGAAGGSAAVGVRAGDGAEGEEPRGNFHVSRCGVSGRDG